MSALSLPAAAQVASVSNFTRRSANFQPTNWGDRILAYASCSTYPTRRLKVYKLRMSMATSTISSFGLDSKPSLHRNVADFHPSIWGDYFLQYSESMEINNYARTKKMELLKEEVRKMLVSKKEEPLSKLNLIDSIHRLGVAYHFELEIDEALQQIHKNYVENEKITLDGYLRSVALLFRILRQHGFRISQNVFNKFKNEKSNFSERLAADVEGMLSLYEAAHLSIHGEDILDEALVFTSTHLSSVAAKLSPSLAEQINYSLRQPLHKGLPRVEARRYISIYQQDPSHNEILLTLAKLDFNMLQEMHKKEFGNICKWWKEMDVPRKFPFARDRIVECCFWILAAYFEPQYSQARQITMKVISLLSIIDDTYDAYGTLQELELLTAAIERWDISCLDDFPLPEYMKLTFESLMKVYEEIDQQMRNQGRAYVTNYWIKQFQQLVQANMTEARWLNSNYKPTTEEYLHMSTISSCYPLLITTSYIGMGNITTEDIFKWITDGPKIVKASAIVCRVMDDIVSNEFEQKRGHMTSVLECYMRDYGVSREDAIQESRKRVRNAWKDMNEECLRPTKVPMPFLMRVLNMTRFADVFYKDADNYTFAGGIMKTHITALLVDPVPM